MRERLTFANVISCIALFVALGGSALAIKANSIGSRQVRDESLRGRDVRDESLQGKDLASGAVGARELAGTPNVAELKSVDGTCNPSSATFVDCGSIVLNLTQPSRVLLIAGGGQYGSASAAGSCKFVADTQTLLDAAPPAFGDDHDRGFNNASAIALTAVAGAVDRIQPGLRAFRLLCNQTAGDVQFNTTFSTVAFGDGLD